MARPNEYVLGGKPEILVVPKDLDDNFFEFSEARLSIKEPTGTILTVSGSDLTLSSGYYYYSYRPPIVGWYEYEVWVKDGAGREDTATNGFDVIDKVF